MSDHQPDPSLAIETVNLRVDYGAYRAVKDVNLKVPRGECFGLIGPNGAGKTSSIKVMATLMKPTHGRVFMESMDTQSQPEDVHRILGYMPDMAPVSEDLKVWEFMEVFAGAYFISRDKRMKKIEECIERVQLTDKLQSMCTSLSRGMQQRLVLAKTLLHDPKVLLLDEPASGLDPLARVNLKKILQSLTDEGKTIVISSHILTEMTTLCSSIGIMQKGELLIQGEIQSVINELKPHYTSEIQLLRHEDFHQTQTLLQEMSQVVSVSQRMDDNVLIVESQGSEEERARILYDLSQAGILLKSYVNKQVDLEDLFFELGAHETA